ncbi:MAG: hypothetical protein J6A13_04750 [Paludibacteraceae bacterium]|nr:hypothetical protein [Paludibacteraceae bacterium]
MFTLVVRCAYEWWLRESGSLRSRMVVSRYLRQRPLFALAIVCAFGTTFRRYWATTVRSAGT